MEDILSLTIRRFYKRVWSGKHTCLAAYKMKLIRTSCSASCQIALKEYMTLPLPKLLVPTPYTKGGGLGLAGPPAVSKTFAPMYVKFCRVLETSLNVLEMLKLFT